jgi:membrane-associated protease RseP (regulator of RpoE activity)
MLSYILPFIALIVVVVFIHEYGHYYFAKRFGVGVTDFSIGFGKEMLGWNDKSGTRWKICVIPLGGYVKFFGDRNVYSQADNEKIIKEVFSHETIEEIFKSCEEVLKNENDFLKAQFEELKHKSPTSLKISLRQIRLAKDMSLEEELIMEYRMVQNCLKIGDFFEGVRAMLVDKDRKPIWKPSVIEKVDQNRENEFFKSLGDLDLKLIN